MKAKGIWGVVIAGVLGLGALIGPPLADSLVKDGKLPDWISGKLTGVSEFLSQQIPFPLWLIILGVLLACALTVEFYKGAVKTADHAGDVARLTDECEKREQRFLQMEEYKSSLLVQLAEKTQALEAMEALEAQRALEVPEVVQHHLSAIGLKVMAIVARCTDRNVKPTLSAIAAAIPVGHVEAHAAIDVLIESGFLTRIASVGGAKFQFTPAGRAFYVMQKEQQG